MKESLTEPLAKRVLFEDNHLIAINKHPGELVQGDHTGDLPLIEQLKDLIKKRDRKPGNVFIGSPHRLDRPVSGVVVFAKTGKALSRMNALFKAHETTKIYFAIVPRLPDPTEGRLFHYLKKNRKKNKSFVTTPPGGKEAILRYRHLSSGRTYHLLEIALETGRHHQIRVQLSASGCPIKGDLKYGAARSNNDGSISLHARELSFVHPVRREPVRLLAPCPKTQPWPDLVASIPF